MKNIFLFLICVSWVTLAHAETIILKSGDVIQGEIIERTDDSYKVVDDIGIPLTYYIENIESIDGQQPMDIVDESAMEIDHIESKGKEQDIILPEKSMDEDNEEEIKKEFKAILNDLMNTHFNKNSTDESYNKGIAQMEMFSQKYSNSSLTDDMELILKGTLMEGALRGGTQEFMEGYLNDIKIFALKYEGQKFDDWTISYLLDETSISNVVGFLVPYEYLVEFYQARILRSTKNYGKEQATFEKLYETIEFDRLPSTQLEEFLGGSLLSSYLSRNEIEKSDAMLEDLRNKFPEDSEFMQLINKIASISKDEISP